MSAQRLAGIGWLNLGTALFGVALSGATAHGGDAKPPIDVMVQVTGAHSIPSSKYIAAKDTVRGIFARIGIRMVWRDRKPETSRAAASRVVIHVQIVQEAIGRHSESAMAYTSPFVEGMKTITVLWDRIRLIGGGSSLEPHLLAYVMAHEIGHVLQATDWHAQRGVMKASWNEADYSAMQKGLLEFTAADVYMIRQGLKSRGDAGAQAGAVAR